MIKSIAIVGSVAALALIGVLNLNESSLENNSNLLLKVSPEVQSAFNNFVSRQQRSFLTQEEFKARLAIFRDNYERVQLHNSQKDVSFKLAINKFADWSKQELQQFMPIIEPTDTDQDHTNEDEVDQYLATDDDDDDLLFAPASVDWRDQGAVTQVRIQGKQCGACHTFSAAGAVEGAYKIKTGKLIEFSKQQLLDCSGNYGNQGCKGGYPTNNFKYLQKNKIQTYDSYPYTGAVQKCSYDASKGIVGVKSYISLPQDDPTALMNAVQKQPVSIGVAGVKDVFYLYKGGVLDDAASCGTKIDHVVLLIGYGTDKATGKDYWLLKNSWGTDWGENGFGRVRRDMTKKGVGMCGIHKLSSYPILA
eukprot:403348594